MNQGQYDWLGQINQIIKMFQEKQHKKPLSNTQFTLSAKQSHKFREIKPPDLHYQLQTNLTLKKIDIKNLKLTKNHVIDEIGMQDFQYGYIAINVTDSGQKFILLNKGEAHQTSIVGLWIYSNSKREDLLWNILVQYVTNFQLNKRSIFKEKTGLIFLFQEKKKMPQKPEQYLFEYPINLQWTIKTELNTKSIKQFTVKDQKNISFAQQNSFQQEFVHLNVQEKLQDSNYFLPSFKNKDSVMSQGSESSNNKNMAKYSDKNDQVTKITKVSNWKKYEQNTKLQQKIEEKMFKGEQQPKYQEKTLKLQQKLNNYEQIDKISDDKLNKYEQRASKPDLIYKYEQKDKINKNSQKHVRSHEEEQLEARLNKYSSNIEHLSEKYTNNSYPANKSGLYQKYKEKEKDNLDLQTKKSTKIVSQESNRLKYDEIVQNKPKYQSVYSNQQQPKKYKEQGHLSPPAYAILQNKKTFNKNYSQKHKKNEIQQKQPFEANPKKKEFSNNIEAQKKIAPELIQRKQKSILDSDSDDQEIKNIKSKYKKK